MTSKKPKKGKTIPLTDFLANESKLVTVRGGTWADIVDKEEAETKPIVVDIGGLPTAPRAAMDVDYSTVPEKGPFVAYIANLSFEIDDEGLRRIFADLKTKSARVLRDGTRSRGTGLVEFETRDHFIEALKRTDKEVYGRKIHVTISDKADTTQTDRGRGGFGSRNQRPAGEERAGLSDKWRRAEPRSDDGPDDRNSGGSFRDRPNREFNRSNMGGGSRDHQSEKDYGFGYPRAREDRGGPSSGAGGRDYNRPGFRNRHHQDDDNLSNSGTDRPRYSGRYSDTRDVRDRNRVNDETGDDQREAPRERPRLQLQPRSKPLEALQPLSASSSSVNNVAANVTDSSISNADETGSLGNTSTGQLQDLSHEHRDDTQHESNDDASRANPSEESAASKAARGAGASIFGGAKPVDTAAREAEIERKLKQMQMASNEGSRDEAEEKSAPPRSYNRNQDRDRDQYRSKRSTHNDDYHNRDRDRRDDGDRYGHGGDYHHKREHSGGRQYEEEPRRRNDDGHHRRGGQDRYGGPSRRDNDSGRSNRFSHQNHPDRDHDRGNNRFRDRDDQRHTDNNDFTQAGGRSSGNNFNSDSQSRHPQRGAARRTLPAEDDSHKLQLSNKFGMLGDDDLDDGDENDELQSPSIEE